MQGRVGTVIRGKWQIEARIGAGGMSTVYAVVDRNGTRAALKMLNLQLSREDNVRQRFLREGYLANQVAHPGVCRVLDDGFAENGCAFLVLELLEGETMEARRLGMGGAMPLAEVLDVADQALDTIAAAHDKGIVHRDVKPENVFLTTSGQVKLLDFGLARLRDANIEATATGITIGTPEFMPPEQAMGKGDVVDARSDVWGVGATMFTALSGKYVHEANTLHEQLVASAMHRARSVLTVAPNVPPAIAQVIDKALELEQGDRWSSAGEMRQALRSARGLPQQAGFGGAPSVTVRAEVPLSQPQPISSDRTVAMSSPAPNSDGPTLESAVQPRPPAAHMTERLSPGLMGAQVTMQLPTQHASSQHVSTAPAHHVSSGSMPSARSAPPPPPMPMGSSGSYPFVQLPMQPPPEPKGSRGAIVASAVLLVTVLAAALYLYLHGMPHLP